MSRKFVCGVLFGAAVGAAVALLFAPKKGEELREELTDKAYDFKDVALDYVELASVKSAELKDAALKKTSHFAENVKSGAADLKNHIVEKSKDLSQNFDAAKASVAEATEDAKAVAAEAKDKVVEAAKDATK